MTVTHELTRKIASSIRSSVQKHYFVGATSQFLRARYSPAAQRLAGHAYIHALQRLGPESGSHLQRNFAVFNNIMDAGVRLHSRTVAMYFRQLIQRAQTTLPYFASKPVIRDASILQKKSVHAANLPLRSALQLFWTLGATSHIRTQEMFTSLIAALIQRKEYLPAALVFDKVAQDCALRLALPSAIEEAKTSGSSNYESLEKRLHHLETENLLPDIASLTLITDDLTANLRHSTDIHNRELAHCIQSAVVLGALMDRDQLPEEGKPIVISLLRDVIHAQSVDERYRSHIYEVFVDVEPEPIAVHAGRYAYQVLVACLGSTGTPDLSPNAAADSAASHAEVTN